MADNKDEKIKVLLADDDDDDSDLFKEALTEATIDAKLKRVRDGLELLDYLDKVDGQSPDIIFLDINMPLKNGIECLKEIRKIKELDNTPVVMFSTSAYKEHIDETFEQGANLYISKPVFFKDEVAILRKIFGSNWKLDLSKRDKTTFILFAAI